MNPIVRPTEEEALEARVAVENCLSYLRDTESSAISQDEMAAIKPRLISSLDVLIQFTEDAREEADLVKLKEIMLDVIREHAVFAGVVRR